MICRVIRQLGITTCTIFPAEAILLMLQPMWNWYIWTTKLYKHTGEMSTVLCNITHPDNYKQRKSFRKKEGGQKYCLCRNRFWHSCNCLLPYVWAAESVYKWLHNVVMQSSIILRLYTSPTTHLSIVYVELALLQHS